MAELVVSPPGEVVLDDFVLRRYKRQDAAALARAVSESIMHLAPWMPWVALEPTTLVARRKLFAQWDRDWAEGRQYSYGMFRHGEVVGGAGLMRRIAPDGLEIGYWVHPRYTRRGYATAAAGALTSIGLALPGVTHIEIHHDRANVISGKVPARLGYELVGEREVPREAPGHTGVNCVWRIGRAAWSERAAAGGDGLRTGGEP